MNNLIIPKHVAIIMDGNARWAKSNNVSLNDGHKAGSNNVRNICEACIELGIKYLTIYAFSTENWNRPKQEVSNLLGLLDFYLKNEIKELDKNGVRLVVSGNLDKLSDRTVKMIKESEYKTSKNDKITLNVAFSYSSKQEIADAVKNIAKLVCDGKIDANQIDENLISKNLYHPEIPDPELLIRTAGDNRLSNFMLWQAAYSELYFTKTLWPDFNKNDLVDSIIDFNNRTRTYGLRK